jgi:DNA-binding NarL/FixJ family response regulator
MKPVRILIADDHDVVRQGVRAVLEGQPGWVVCGEASTGREAVAKAVDLQPDVVVLDISMPELNGLEATRQIRRAVSARILILTVHESDQVVTEVLDAGAHGYVLKTDAGRTLVEAIGALLGRRPTCAGTSYAAPARGGAAAHRRQVQQGDRRRARDNHQDRGNTPDAHHGQAPSPLDE